ncbi:GntR family transcriptional regulator [Microbacterium sp. W4I4]|uniref:GntR family transcriptional regulator n=1 Tax=Microbacterium sp. W4I4 TaxID=3042295 RepID=UPI00278968EA|nr:GntR family transcriptional regulator [Microbacterium sp. W4I4]MDQ0614060.1 GntR family transcriptional regulator [Microbacterium sp. W4I4]
MRATKTSFLDSPLLTPPGQPLRIAVYSRIAEGIRTNTFRLGEALPRETELAVSLGVSRTVVREALMLLEEDGLIVTKRGIGRFVTDSIPRVGLEELRPFEEVLAEPNSALSVRGIEFTLQQATDFASTYLHLDSEANIWFRESLVSVSSNPLAIVQEYLPAGRGLSDVSEEFARFLPEAAEADATVLKSVLDRLGPIFNGAVCHIAANVVGQTRGRQLGMKASEPVLILTQTAEINGTPTYLAKCIVSAQVGSLSVMQSSG